MEETNFVLDVSLEELENRLRGDKQTSLQHNVEPVYNPTDLGNAKRLVAQHGNKIRFCFAWKKWLIWDGKAWHVDNDGQILRLAKDTVKRIYEEAATIADTQQRQSIAKWAVSSESEHRLNAMVSLAQSEPGVPISPQELDVNPFLLNCLNGTIDLKTGKLKPHDPKDFITKIVPVEYNTDAGCPRWIGFLETIFNWNYDIILFIQRAAGYSLTGDISEQCIFLLHGSGCNGKTTFIDGVSLLFGAYAQSADFETFLIKKNESIRNDIARMTGKRFISAIEAEGERRLAEVLVKQLTGGDTITARFLFGEYFDFKPTFKIWLAANHKPNIKGTDHAIWRRIRLIPFNVTIPEEKRIQQSKLLSDFKNELPGILTWAVQGCLAWQKNGLQTPEEVKSATIGYKNEMDAVGIFLNECCVMSNDSAVKTMSGILYEAYKKWCVENGEFSLDNRKFGKRLAEHGLQGGQANGKRFWIGVGLHEQYR
ncbi:MAG TPA: DNA primase family protein [Candidatus Wunengus sp. YC60]|uniref:DNA primase family protein n=1 Tax=Candidatus Wunengus sp. YC60 TaxID=3367697 RepID=UPI0040251E7A